MTYGIRLARADEFPLLQEIEHASDELFGEVGMPEIYEMGNVMPADEMRRTLGRGHLWVAADENDEALGWVLCELIDAGLHMEQLCVSPIHQRKGIGRALFDVTRGCAAASGARRVTLSTFLDVPWNAPVYERWGFRVVEEDELTADLRRIQQAEFDRGLTAMKRVCMAFDINSGD